MNEKTRALVEYRLEQAERSLGSSKTLLDGGDLPGSVNRSYYAMFYAVLALLAREGTGTSKHAGAVALFGRDFVRKGIFPEHFGRWMRAAFDLRLRADYREFFAITQDQAQEALSHATEFLAAIRRELGTEDE